MKKESVLCVALLMSLIVPGVLGSANLDLEKYRGKVVYVDFWASWCTPCKASFPFMHDMAEKYGESLAIAAISVDKSRTDADLFLEQFDINFDVFYDPEGSLASSFDVKGMPTSYLFDRRGNLIGSHIGFRKKDIARLEATIKKAIDSHE